MSLDVTHEKHHKTHKNLKMPLKIWHENMDVTVPVGKGKIEKTYKPRRFDHLAGKVGVKVHTAISGWSLGYDGESREFSAASVLPSAKIDFATGTVTPKLEATISDGNQDDGLILKGSFLVIVDWSDLND